jgi:hypothetical protein
LLMLLDKRGWGGLRGWVAPLVSHSMGRRPAMLEGNFLGQLVAAGLTLGVLVLVSQIFNRSGKWETLAAFVLMITIYWVGPKVFGRDWFEEGFAAGTIFGGYFFHTLTHDQPPAGFNRNVGADR